MEVPHAATGPSAPAGMARPAPQAAPAAGDPSAAQILTDAFEDLRRRMVTIEGRIVSMSSHATGADIDGDAPEAEAKPVPTGPGPVLRLLHAAMIGAVFFGIGVLAAERVPEVAAAGNDAATWAEAQWRDGAATVAALLQD